MKRSTLQSILNVVLHCLIDLKFEGLEHIPTEGGILVTTNHLSRFDIVILFVTPNRKDITALVADKYQRYSVFSWIVRTAEGIWIDRSKADFVAFGEAVKVIRKGLALGIAPEGTRSRNGKLLEGKSGAVLLASRAGVPIVPVGIAGSESVVQMLKRLRRPKVTVRFGAAYQLPPMDREQRENALKKYTEEVMCRIAALLPEEYHGFYTGHPRLAELRSEGN
ncbi:MAG: lysophospholipid acyltransferase family protein [Anaerolineaceae bacterium]|nr:lysophospholipid acyltransferase family protein [Anaerolineaceae bacterium]